jgi:hypothetical protein
MTAGEESLPSDRCHSFDRSSDGFFTRTVCTGYKVNFLNSCFFRALSGMLLVALGSPSICKAQAPGPEVTPNGQTKDAKEAADSPLLDGLLELLESSSGSSQKDATRSADIDSAGSKAGIQGQRAAESSDRGGTELDLGQADIRNPLLAVKEIMQSISESMRKGLAGDQTLRLQGNVVERLDSLIGSLENRESTQNRSRSADSMDSEGVPEESQETQETPADQTDDELDGMEPSGTTGDDSLPGEDTQEARADGEGDGEGEGSSGGDQPAAEDESNGAKTGGTEGDAPGQSGMKGQVKMQPIDPGELQRSVWGHLPERIRSQLQARMIEQFLPGYREQLEAYYRGLLEQGNRE